MSSEQEQGPSGKAWDRKHTNNKYTKMLISKLINLMEGIKQDNVIKKMSQDRHRLNFVFKENPNNVIPK